MSPKDGWLLAAAMMVLLAPVSVWAQSGEGEGLSLAEAQQETFESLSGPTAAMRGDAAPVDTGLLSVNLPRFTLAALGGGVAGALLGVTGYYATGFWTCLLNDFSCSLTPFLVGAGIGGAIGVLGGTLLVGRWMDGDGAWWGALAGMAAGVGLGVAAGSLVEPAHVNLVTGATLGGAVLLGALGYELTSHHSARQFKQTRLALSPTVLPDSRGALGLGLALAGSWN